MIELGDRKAMKARLARIEGQLRGLQRMMDDTEIECEAVAQQMSAARKALDKAAHSMLACMVKDAARSGKQDELDELEKLIGKYA